MAVRHNITPVFSWREPLGKITIYGLGYFCQNIAQSILSLLMGIAAIAFPVAGVFAILAGLVVMIVYRVDLWTIWQLFVGSLIAVFMILVYYGVPCILILPLLYLAVQFRRLHIDVDEQGISTSRQGLCEYRFIESVSIRVDANSQQSLYIQYIITSGQKHWSQLKHYRIAQDVNMSRLQEYIQSRINTKSEDG